MFNVIGIISIVVFYLVILLVGIWAGRKRNKNGDAELENMLAGQNIGSTSRRSNADTPLFKTIVVLRSQFFNQKPNSVL
jgi:hypothetical protein